MPTSGDLKSGDSFFCISPPNINDQPPSAPHKHKFNPVPNRLRTLYEVFDELQTITISFHDFVSDEIRAKITQKPNFES